MTPRIGTSEKRICTVSDCGRKHRRTGLCDMHDQRMKHTETTDSPVKTMEERFWSKVNKHGPIIRRDLGRCWVWTAATKEGGYGVMRPTGQRSGPSIKAHRVSLMLAGVDIDGKVVRHRCDNPPCVNPAHLLAGTQMQNARDTVQRGRIAKGERRSTKLTEADVRSIRARAADGDLHRVIAADYSVARSNVTRIVNRQGWAHVA